MKKRLASILLALVMLLSLLPTAALAEATENCPGSCEHKAAIGTTHYDTLADAIEAVPTDGTATITMLKDYFHGSAVTFNGGKNITLDLGGFVLSGNSINVQNAELTLKNGTVKPYNQVNGIQILGNSDAPTWATTKTNSIVTIAADCTVDLTSHDATNNCPGVLMQGNGAVLNVYGNITGDLTGSYRRPAVQGNGTVNGTTNHGGTEINIYEGAGISVGRIAFYLPQNGVTNIYGGTISGYAGIGIKSGTLNISGGEIIGTANDIDLQDSNSSQNGISVDGSAIVIDSNLGYAGQMNINITGGTVKGNYAYAIHEIGDDASQNIVSLNISGGKVYGGATAGGHTMVIREKTKTDGVVSLSGGYYTNNVSAYVADGYQCIETPETDENYGTYHYMIGVIPPVAKIGDTTFTSLDDALAAAQSGDTIELLADVEMGVFTIPDGVDLTSDPTNKKTITVKDNNTTQTGKADVVTIGQGCEITNINFVFDKILGEDRAAFGAYHAFTMKDCAVTLTNNIEKTSYCNYVFDMNTNTEAATIEGCTFTDNMEHTSNPWWMTWVVGFNTGRDGTTAKFVFKDNKVVGNWDEAIDQLTGCYEVTGNEIELNGSQVSDQAFGIAVLPTANSEVEYNSKITGNTLKTQSENAALVRYLPSGGTRTYLYDNMKPTVSGNKLADGSKGELYSLGIYRSGTGAIMTVVGSEPFGSETYSLAQHTSAGYAKWNGVAKTLRTVEGKKHTAYYAALDLDENKDYLEAFTDAKPGDTIILLDNIALAEPARLDKVGTFTIDGNGHKITAAEGASFGADGCLCFGPDGGWTADDVAKKIYTVKNTTFSGFGSAVHDVIRAEGCTLTINGCTFKNNEIAGTARNYPAVVRFSGAVANVFNCVFNNNKAQLCIDFNTQGGSENSQTQSNVKVDNCYFHNNTLSGNGVIYLYGPKGSVTNNTFESNSIAANGAAVIYLSGKADRITNNLFKSNTVTAGGSGKLGVIAFGSSSAGTALEENAFVGNALNKDGKASTSGTAYVGAENISLERNYWGDGLAAEKGDAKDIYEGKDVAVTKFATAYTLKSNSYGVNVYVYAPEKVPENIAKEGDNTYTTYAAAQAAAENGKFGAGWYFNVDPSADLAENCIVVASDNADWLYMVKEKAAGTADVKTDIEPGEEKAQVAEEASGNTAAASAATAVNNVDKTLGGVKDLQPDAASKLNDSTVITEALKGNAEQALTNEENVSYNSETDTLMLVVEPYFDVEVKGGETDETETAKITSITYQIDAKYNILATTAATTEQIVKEGAGQNTVTVETGKPLTVTKAVTLSIPLPDEFYAVAGETVIVKHTHDDKTYLYDGTIVVKGEQKFVTFTNPDGFSEFEIMKATLLTGAKIERTAGTQFYATLEEAVADVKNGETIVLLSDAAAETITVGRVVTFTVKNDGHSNAASIVAGNGYTVSKNGNTYTVTEYVAPHHRGGSSKPVTPPVVEPETNEFVDVPTEAYYAEAVAWAADKGITKGTDALHFSPSAPVTRAQAVTFLWRAAGCPKPATELNPFTDVKADAYYYEAVLWAVENGITKGTTETTFSPDKVCTRAHIVTFLARFAGVEDTDTGYTHGFTDVKTVDYFNNAVAWAKENKVTEGTTPTSFSPNDDCTRAQVVTFIYRWMVK